MTNKKVEDFHKVTRGIFNLLFIRAPDELHKLIDDTIRTNNPIGELLCGSIDQWSAEMFARHSREFLCICCDKPLRHPETLPHGFACCYGEGFKEGVEGYAALVSGVCEQCCKQIDDYILEKILIRLQKDSPDMTLMKAEDVMRKPS